MNWKEFCLCHNRLEQSHQGLQQQLIPAWLKTSPQTLSSHIDSSAYGETPESLIDKVLKSLDVGESDVFLDLGCGAGNVCQRALSTGAKVVGIERNPKLFALALQYLGQHPGLKLICADFLHTDWGTASIAYATTARYAQTYLKAMAKLAQSSPNLRALACLGKPLPLELGQGLSVEDLGKFSIRWNDGEAVLKESLFIYRLARPTK